jgi:hypothetical protein
LQGAYLIIAARALGLDCGPMSGFDNAGVDAEFFAGTPRSGKNLCTFAAPRFRDRLHAALKTTLDEGAHI